MAKPEKVERVADLKQRIEGAGALLLADYRGLTVGDAKELREGLADADASFAVVKNTLFRRAADDAGLDALGPLVTGPTAAVFVKGDAVLAAKRLAEASKKFEALEIKGGYMDGKLLSAEEAAALAKLKSRDEMLSQLAGMMKADMSRAASMFQALQGKFLGLLEAYKEKVPAGDAAGSEPEASEEAAPAAEAATDVDETPAAPAETVGTSETTDEAPEAPSDGEKEE